MMAIANYVLKRGSRFVWRRRLPNKQVVQISLSTSDQARARHLAALVTACANDLIDDMGIKLTAGAAKGLFDRVVREETAALERRHLRPRAMRLPAEDADWHPELVGRAFLAALRNGEISDEDRRAMADLGYGPPESDNAAFQAWAAFMQIAKGASTPFVYPHAATVARTTVDTELRLPETIDSDHLLPAYRVVLAARAAALMPHVGISMETAAETRSSDALDPAERLLPLEWTLPAGAPPSDRPADDGQPSDLPSKSSRWEDVVERYVRDQEKNGVKPAEQKQTGVTARLFAEATGIRDVRDVRQAHLANFRDTLRALPKNYGRSVYDRGLTVAQLIAKADADPVLPRGLSPGTINSHLSKIKAILSSAKYSGIKIHDALNFEGLRLKDPVRKRDKRPSFSFDDVQTIFRHPLWQGAKSDARRRIPGDQIIKDGQYWLPLIAAYTGARREDIAALTFGDISKIDGITCFNIGVVAELSP